MSGAVGIDVGATLCKLARLDREVLETTSFAARELDAARRQVAAWRPARVAATGGGASELGDRVAGVPVAAVGEFDAWAAGARLLATRDGTPLPSRCLVVSLGTGTSALLLHGGSVHRAGGTALGGGTVLGLGRLLLGVGTFDELTRLAARGDRRRVDLLVGDVYHAAHELPLLAESTASSFAKLDSTAPEDVAHALMNLVGENVALVAAGLAREHDVDTVVYCGSTLTENPALRDVVDGITRFFGRTPRFLAHGAYCGAVGAAARVAHD